MKLFVIAVATVAAFGLAAGAQVRSSRRAPVPVETVRPEDRCSVEGTVFNSTTGEPLRKTAIVMRPADGGPRNRGAGYSAVSDAAGRFLLTNVSPGKYRISAERAGFARQEFGARRPSQPGSIVALAPAENRKSLDLRLTPQGVVTGRVVDEDGDPVPHVLVSLSRRTYLEGRRRLTPVGQGASTNDLGEYRIFGLAPGRYYLSATYRRGGLVEMNADGGSEEAYPPTFYPGATSSDGAAPLDVAAGATLQGVDLRLQKMSATRITGLVVTPDNQPARAIVMLMPRSDGALAYMGQRVSRAFDGQGRFRFNGVTPGSYYLAAQMNGGDERLWARMQIEVGAANLDDIVLTLAPGAELTGVVKSDGTQDAVPSGLRISLQSDSHTRRSASPVSAGGAFKLANIMPDVYHVSVDGLPETAYVKSIRFGSADVAESGLDFAQGVPPGELLIAVANTAAQVDGSVQDSSGQPASSIRVVLLPEKTSDLLRPRIAMTDQNGQFAIGGLAPGDYKAYAFDEIENGAWEDPEFMKPFENNAQKITVSDNDRQTVQLKLILAQS